MNDNDIIKNLLYCASKECKCEKCDLYDADDAFTCSSNLKLAAVDLINRLLKEKKG